MPDQITNEQYLAVLETEIEALRNYYKPKQEGTGHFNTAASVLQHRIDEIKKKMEQNNTDQGVIDF
jgi:predicted  nucleic acid-binding Zn-ribbon protein